MWNTNKAFRQFCDAKGMPKRVANKIAHKIPPGILRACSAIATKKPASATNAPGERKSPSISAFVFGLASTNPAFRKPKTATNRPIDAVNPSLIDWGTERVTTSRKPNLVNRKIKFQTNKQCRALFASQCLHYLRE